MPMAESVATYFDGETSARRHVHVATADAGLRIIAGDGRAIAEWPWDEIREVGALAGALRLTREGFSARLEVRAPATVDAIRKAAPSLGARDAGLDRKIVLWSLAAAASLLGLAFFGLPLLADRLAPALPWSVDRRMGQALDAQIRLLLPVRAGGFACGSAEAEQAGRRALDRLAKRLTDAAGLPLPVEIVVVRSGLPNAFALPGGPIYLFDGLIQRAASGDEIAGVLAHEIGHVAVRDGAKRALQAGGFSFLFGFVLGDFVGGGAAVAAARALAQASYSRAAEMDADRYSVNLMKKDGGDPRALGALLLRLTGEDKTDGADPLAYIASHPGGPERRDAIDTAAGAPAPTSPMLDAATFADFRHICGARA
jgi:Zn-dependent protease with chaperone function